jgi:hypothetical protein
MFENYRLRMPRTLGQFGQFGHDVDIEAINLMGIGGHDTSGNGTTLHHVIVLVDISYKLGLEMQLPVPLFLVIFILI